MNEAKKRQAEAFARAVMADEKLAAGLAALCEGLEWSVFERWRVATTAEQWGALAGELAAVRNMVMTIKTVGIEHGKSEQRNGPGVEGPGPG